MAEIRLHRDEADGGLPDICMCCGGEATVTKTKKMSWCPPWVGVLILFGLLPYAIVAMILTKRATVQVPLCKDHAGHWFNRGLVVWGTFFLLAIVSIGAFVAISVMPRGADDLSGFVCLGSALLFLVWIIILAIAQSTAIRPKEISDRDITLQNVSGEFVDAVEEHDRDRRARRKEKRERHEDEDDEPRPRPSPRRDSDAIQDRKRPRDEDFEDEPRPRKKRPPENDEE